ncbi:MAG: N-acetyltransferase [Desulfovibrio sp.]|nr:N-acetyltransferase [Desulfovibrio sp.]
MPIAIPRFDSGFDIVPEVSISDASALQIRPARVGDVHGMSSLINYYAASNVMLARGPQYLYQHIQDYMVITAPAVDSGQETVVACGSLHVLWEDLAEIRSIAVHHGCQRHGLGRRLVEALVERCRMLGIPRVFVFTLAESFFRHCGLTDYQRDKLPPVVWVECSKCPKFYRCDEIVLSRLV